MEKGERESPSTTSGSATLCPLPPPAVPSTVSRTGPSSLSRTGRTRPRLLEDELFDKAFDEMKETREMIQRHMEKWEDPITLYTEIIGVMLQKVAEEDQDEAMHDVYTVLYGRIKRHNANPTQLNL